MHVLTTVRQRRYYYGPQQSHLENRTAVFLTGNDLCSDDSGAQQTRRTQVSLAFASPSFPAAAGGMAGGRERRRGRRGAWAWAWAWAWACVAGGCVSGAAWPCVAVGTV